MKIMRYRKMIRWLEYLLLTVFLLVSATTLAINNTGKILVGFIEDHAIPYVLKTDDVAMGCVMAEALTLLIPSLAQLNASPYKLEVIFNFLSGSCAEFKAREEELRYIRAMHIKNVTEAQDARILQKRFLSLAAQRQLKGYLSLELAFPEILGNQCPDFTRWNDEFYWLVGLMDGLQAVLNDLASEGGAKVPLDISLKVGRGASCLNNKRWWGLPSAIQAAIWVSFPGHKPAGSEPLTLLDQAMVTGLQHGIRIAQVIAAKIYIGLGNSERVKEIIRSNAQTRSNLSTNPDYLFLNQIVSIQLQAISDFMWTEATGKRTPIGGLGTFWDDPKNTQDTIDISDIL
ncbi:MAG: hypothetical protein GQ583_10880 [Methyloprofundus sp.]|nr:hypothetical protein [Methyloprofundus sp.]